MHQKRATERDREGGARYLRTDEEGPRDGRERERDEERQRSYVC